MREGWESRPLIELASYHNGAAFKPSDWSEDGLPIIRIEQINNPSAETDRFEGYVSPLNIIDTGDLIFSWSATLKVVLWTGGLAVLNQHLYKVVPTTETDICFLLHLLDHNMERLSGQSQGCTMKHVTRKELSKFRVPVPTAIKHQRKIAAILQTVDEAIEQTEALIGKYERIKAGMMQDLFTRGLTPDGKLRPPRDAAPDLYQQTPIGWIPKEWELTELGNRIEIIDPNPSHRYPIEAVEGIPICSTENFEGLDGYSFLKSKRVPLSVYDQQNIRCRFAPSDVVFARKGRIGLARRYGDQTKVFSHSVVTMKPLDDTVNASWVLWLARCHWIFEGIDRNMNTNSGVPTLGVDFIKRVAVPFPSPKEQSLFLPLLESNSEQLEIEASNLKKLRLQKAGLMQDLLSGKVPVKMDA